MKRTIRISKAEYDELREYRFKQLFCKPNTMIVSSRDEENIRLKKSLIDIKKQLDEKDKEIDKLKEGISWRQDGIVELEDEIDKKNDEIERLKGEIECQRKSIERMSQQLTEHELFEKKMKEYREKPQDTADALLNTTIERMCRLEAKYEAKENPYFF